MNKVVGNNLKTLRKAKNMSQEEVADHLNISQSAYARMERGESTSWASHFNKICEVFVVSPEELVKKEFGGESYGSLIEMRDQTETAQLTLYKKLIGYYELQIEDLKFIIRNLNKGKN